MEELLDAKKSLYLLLLNQIKLTDNEVELMFLLSKDEQIKEFLKSKKTKQQ